MMVNILPSECTIYSMTTVESFMTTVESLMTTVESAAPVMQRYWYFSAQEHFVGL